MALGFAGEGLLGILGRRTHLPEAMALVRGLRGQDAVPVSRRCRVAPTPSASSMAATHPVRALGGEAVPPTRLHLAQGPAVDWSGLGPGRPSVAVSIALTSTLLAARSGATLRVVDASAAPTAMGVRRLRSYRVGVARRRSRLADKGAPWRRWRSSAALIPTAAAAEAALTAGPGKGQA